MGIIKISFVAAIMLMTSACATLMNSATGKMADNLTLAILNQGDLETVRSGAPAYLLMIDGLIQGSPDDSDLLLAGSKLYSSYTSAFIDDPERARRMSRKSFEYATRAVCADLERLCTAMEGQTDEFRDAVAGVQGKNLPLVYGLATAWTGWLQANSDDWNAVIDLPRLRLLFERCLELDERFDGGGA
ncbi:MAG: TRAP transporter TatT component family protein, partial [Gammaproteobacteria bacterium]